jgi:hypothetical protein
LFGADVGLLEDEDGAEALPAWMSREVTKLRAVATSDDWLALPDDYRCETAAEIERFCGECCEEATRRELQGHIRRGTSVGLLKAKLAEHGLHDEWKEFRRERIAELVSAWLIGKGITFRT